MKKFFSFVSLLLLLAGCGLSDSTSSSVIDWVDFINWEGKQYIIIDSGVIANPSFIGEKLGEVQFHVYENVSDPNYEVKDGDAAFHEEGTAIFSVKGIDLLAVKVEEEINGYRLYYPVEEVDYQWRYEDVSKEAVERIGVYHYTQTPAMVPEKLTEWTDEKAQELLKILEDGKSASEEFTPAMNPDYFSIVLYTDSVVAYQYTIAYDGETYFWYPFETAVLSDDVEEFLQFPEKTGEE